MTGNELRESLGSEGNSGESGDLRAARQLEMFEERLRSGLSQSSAPPVNSHALRAVQVLQQVFQGVMAPGPQPPLRIGRFEVVGLLGTGRFGVVWRAFDPESRRQVAVKVFQPGLVFDEAQCRRFHRECQLAAQLDHHGIVPTYERQSIGDLQYLVMPVCEGLTLDRWQASQPAPIPYNTAVFIARQLADAAHYGHVHGIVHRDLKPDNIIVAHRFGRQVSVGPEHSAGCGGEMPVSEVWILDFGLAIPMEISLHDTRGSVVAGTPLYMAPEQAECRLDDIGSATDVFAIGAILCELLSGEPPFHAASLPEVLARFENETPLPIRAKRRDVPRDLEAVCLRCLARNPRDRYADAQQLALDLERIINDRPVSAHRPGPLHRIVRWSGQRRGRQTLSQWCVAINVLMLVWCIVALPVSLWQVHQEQDVAMALMPYVSPLVTGIVPLHLSLIWISRQIPRRTCRRWHCIAGLVLSCSMLVDAVAVMLGAPPPAPAYMMNALARAASFTRVSVSATFLAVAFLLATCSFRAEGESLRG